MFLSILRNFHIFIPTIEGGIEMNFQELKSKIGFGFAMVISYKKLPKMFIDNITFNKWIKNLPGS